jgi:2-oxoglutarate dehydrogenase E1 component
MLRHPEASSSIGEFSSGSFLKVRPDLEATDTRRILLCTGKIGHELRIERRKKKDLGVAITFVEQLYPFPEAEIAAELQRHPNAREIMWVQEEPANMGALNYMLPRLRHLAGERPVLSVKRSASPSPATGSAKAHDVEQKALLSLALTANGH